MEKVDVAIIGTGFGGLAMAAALTAAGIGPFVLLEKETRVGGTWRDNTYPGAACDVTSSLYSLSTHPNVWARKYSGQAEILEYLEEVLDAEGLRSSVRFGGEVVEMAFDESAGRWLVTTSDGSVIDARVVVSAVGQLNRPAMPGIEGIDSFAGDTFHSARWDHRVSMAGRRIGIIGTGASAIQFAPIIAEQGSHTTIFQRSAPYVVPRNDAETPGWLRRLYRMIPAAQRPARLKRFAIGELFGRAVLGDTRSRAIFTSKALGFMRSQIDDPALAERCTPDYEFGCKRVLISDDWYPTLVRSDVDLVTERIVRVTPDGVETADGTHHDLDVLVFGTGFESTSFLAPMRVVGRGGDVLEERWADGAAAFRGVAVSGFPNLFVLYGPNTNLGTNSIVYMLEAQAGYVAGLLAKARAVGAGTLEVRPGPERAWQEMVDAKSRATSWLSGCQSWYTTKGKNTNNWPDATWRYGRLLRDVDLLDFDLRPAVSAGVPA